MTLPNELPAPPAVELSPAIQTVVHNITDLQLRRHVESVVCFALSALDALMHIKLPEEGEQQKTWSAAEIQACQVVLAPQVLQSLVKTNQLLAYIMATFDAPSAEFAGMGSCESFDLEFDTTDKAKHNSLKGVWPENKTAQHAVTAPMNQAHLGYVVHNLAALLRESIGQFGQRLKQNQHAVEPQDLWWDIDTGRHHLDKAIQGLLFGTLEVFEPHLRRERIWPRYEDSVREAVLLRTAVTRLARQSGTWGGQLAQEPHSEVRQKLYKEILEALDALMQSPAYALLWVADRRAFVAFRDKMVDALGDPNPHSVLPMRQTIDGLHVFLGTLYAINHREVLVLHDRQLLQNQLTVLQACLERLAAGDAPSVAEEIVSVCAPLLTQLQAMYGRSEMLDTWLQNDVVLDAQDLKKLQQTLAHWQDNVRHVLREIG